MSFIKVFNENVETDLSFQNMLWFAKQAFLGNSSGAKLDTAQVNFVTMPNKNVSCWSRVYHSYQSYVTPNAQELLELVNNELSPFVEPSTMSDLDIMSVNSDGSVSSTTGHVEDSKAAAAPVISSGKKDEPAKDYDMDSNGNLIDPDTGEVIAPQRDGNRVGYACDGTHHTAGAGNRRFRCLHRRRKRLHRRRKRLRQRRDAGGAG